MAGRERGSRWQNLSWPDLALVGALLLVGLNGTGPAAENQGTTVPVTGYLLVVAACLPVVVWRWRPLWALVGTGAATATWFALGYPYGPVMLPLVVAVFGYASRVPLRRAALATGVLAGAGAVALAAEVATGGRTVAQYLTGTTWLLAWLIVPAAVGAVVKARRDAVANVRAEQARRAVSEERLRLAQEVHDAVGHHLAVIAMQSGVVLRAFDKDPARARAGVESIRAMSTEALDQLRAELDAMRRSSPRPEAPHRPRTGLADLPELVDRIRASGLPVTLKVTGGAPGAGLPPEVDHAAYRILQEGLTNVLRHGGPDAVATVRVDRGGDALRLEVTNTGAPARVDGVGHGIAGMRERAAALGGTLSAGPEPPGRFTVRAHLPLAGTHPREETA